MIITVLFLTGILGSQALIYITVYKITYKFITGITRGLKTRKQKKRFKYNRHYDPNKIVEAKYEVIGA